MLLDDEELNKSLSEVGKVEGHRRVSEATGRFKGQLTPFWIGYEVLVSLLMTVCLIVLYVYDFSLTPKAPFTVSTNAYDADMFAPSRYFMLRRQVRSLWY